MKIDYFLLAEAIAQDARGAVTAVGLNQNVFAPPSFPAQTKRAILLNVVEDEPGEMDAGADVAVDMRVVSPTGRVLAATTQRLTAGVRPFSSLPGNLLVQAEIALHFDESGPHLVVADVRAGSWHDEAQLTLFVVERPSPPAR